MLTQFYLSLKTVLLQDYPPRDIDFPRSVHSFDRMTTVKLFSLIKENFSLQEKHLLLKEIAKMIKEKNVEYVEDASAWATKTPHWWRSVLKFLGLDFITLKRGHYESQLLDEIRQYALYELLRKDPKYAYQFRLTGLQSLTIW